MDTNSRNQTWSFWSYRIYPAQTSRPPYPMVKENCARFGRLLFGSATEMRLRCATDEAGRLYWEMAVRSEGHPVHDPMYAEWMHDQWRKFFRNGFGATCDVQCHARLEAGSRQDGTAPDQLVILPAIIETGGG